MVVRSGKVNSVKAFVSLRELEKARASGAEWSVKPFQTTVLCKPIGIPSDTRSKK
jgi:hypothetical protein